MKQIVGLIIIITFLPSCSESFKTIDPKTFNEKIAERTDIKTPEQLITLYYNYPENEGHPTLTIKVNKTENGYFEITLVSEGLEDDSLSGEKIVMKAKLNGQKWVVTEIKKNWKCLDGRGHTSWGTKRCN
jgi:hypothetical protein